MGLHKQDHQMSVYIYLLQPTFFFSSEFSSKSYLILELATNTLGIFQKKVDEIAKSIFEKY
jgi:hypothetical protein